MTTATLDKLSQSKSGQVSAWCPSCFVQFTETTLPTIEQQRGTRPFDMTPFMRFLTGRIDELKPLLRHPVNMRVALHRHPGAAGVMEAAETLLRAVPGVELVDLQQPAIGLQSVNLSVLPAYKREVQLKELEAARDAGVDALAAVYHSDHRELCAHERDWPFRIINVLEIIGASMGCRRGQLQAPQGPAGRRGDPRRLWRPDRRARPRCRGRPRRGGQGDARRPAAAAAIVGNRRVVKVA